MRRSAHTLAKRALQVKARTSSSAAPCQPSTSAQEANGSIRTLSASTVWSPPITIDNINPQVFACEYVVRGETVAYAEENDGDHVPCTKSSNQVVETSLGSTRHMASLSAEGSPSASSTSSEMISVTFVDKNGDEKSIKVPLGMSMLEAAHQNDIELEGACEGSIACSTCHVIVMDEKFYSKLLEPTDEENDMLDLAFGLTERSRLGCQVLAKPELDGIRLAIPSATRNFAVDGYVPKPH